MKKKAPKFFCENCGEEVKENAKICTHCGKFFTNIRCPKCFHQGDSKEFKNGCPECGYSNNKNNFNQKDENESKKYNGNFFKNYIKNCKISIDINIKMSYTVVVNKTNYIKNI